MDDVPAQLWRRKHIQDKRQQITFKMLLQGSFLQSHRGKWRRPFYNFWECICLSQDNDLSFMTYITPDITPMNHICNEAFSFLWARLDPRNLQRSIKDGEWYSSTLALGNPSDECLWAGYSPHNKNNFYSRSSEKAAHTDLSCFFQSYPQI